MRTHAIRTLAHLSPAEYQRTSFFLLLTSLLFTSSGHRVLFSNANFCSDSLLFFLFLTLFLLHLFNTLLVPDYVTSIVCSSADIQDKEFPP